MATDPHSWQTAYGVVVTVDGKAFQHTTGRFRHTVATFDTTNDQSAGWTSIGVAEQGITLQGTIAVDLLATNKVPSTRVYLSFSFNDGAKTYSGNGYVTSYSGGWGGKGGYSAEYELTSTGAVTIS